MVARKRSPDGRRVAMAVRFSEAEAAVVDAARGGMDRSAWLRSAALAAARGDSPAPAAPVRQRRQTKPPPPPPMEVIEEAIVPIERGKARKSDPESASDIAAWFRTRRRDS